MSPRAAGLLAIAVSVVVAVLGALLLASPPWSIPGALVLVGATILLSVGTVWLYRRSWSEPWPPDVTPSIRQRLRRLRILQTLNSVLFVATIAMAVYAIVNQHWGQLIYAAALALMALSSLSVNRVALRHLREIDAGSHAP